MSNYSDLQEPVIRDLWIKGVKGWRFEPPFTLDGHENQLKAALGGHNARAHFFCEGRLYAGVMLHCQCSICLGAQCTFSMDKKINVIAQQVGGLSITRVSQ